MNSDAPGIIVATYNGSSLTDSDLPELACEVKARDIDIIAIQTIKRTSFNSIIHSFKVEGYNYIQYDRKECMDLTFYRLPTEKKEHYRFVKTSEAKGYSKLIIKISTAQGISLMVCVVSAQLDSGSVAKTAQIAELGALKNVIPHPIIFIGDTGIKNWQTSIQHPDGWFDTWREKGTSTTEHTSEFDREDRIWYSNKLRCTRHSLMCLDRNHKGVVASFELVETVTS